MVHRSRLALYTLAVILLASPLYAADRPEVADAAQQQDTTLLRTLIRRGVDVNLPQADGTTALIWAAHWGDADSVAMLIEAGAKVNGTNRYGVSALLEASNIGSLPVVQALVAARADVSLRSLQYGETPLMTAARGGHTDVVRLLLDHEADVNARDAWQQQTALMRAVAEGHPATVQLLIERGADVNLEAHVLELPRRPNRAFLAERITGGLTALMFAARQGDLASARLLLDAGADVRAADRDAITVMNIAVMNGNFDVAALLLERGADANDGSLWETVEFRNLRNSDSFPAVTATNRTDAASFIGTLMEGGADPNRAYAKRRTTRGVRGTSTGQPPNTTAFQRASQSADVQVMKAMLAKGGDPKVQGQAGSALMSAMNAGNAVGAGKLQFRTATRDDLIEAVRLCLDNGVAIDSTNNNGNTALHLAAQAGADDLVTYLAGRGAKLDVKNNAGFTPLDLAMAKGANPNAAVPLEPHESTAQLLRDLMNRTASADLR